jgi:hypothetical protein
VTSVTSDSSRFAGSAPRRPSPRHPWQQRNGSGSMTPPTLIAADNSVGHLG